MAIASALLCSIFLALALVHASPGAAAAEQMLRLTPTARNFVCGSSTRFESCGGGNCCTLPKRCCSTGCCDESVTCQNSPTVRVARFFGPVARKRRTTALKLDTTSRIANCDGESLFESCSSTTCCVLPKCCCGSGTGCCDRVTGGGTSGGSSTDGPTTDGTTTAPTTGNPGSAGSKCFPGSATVTLRSGARRRMQDLRVGDDVRVGAAAFSRVYAFSHASAAERSMYLRLETATGHVVTATHGHLLLVLRHGTREPTPADGVRVGDMLPVLVGGAEVGSRVVQIREVAGRGLYNPHTLSGELVVDDVVCSTYTRHVPMVAAHGLLAPVRAAYELLSLLTCPLSG